MTSIGRANPADRVRQAQQTQLERTAPAAPSTPVQETRAESPLARERMTDAFESGARDPSPMDTPAPVRSSLTREAPAAAGGDPVFSSSSSASTPLRGGRASSFQLGGAHRERIEAGPIDGHVSTLNGEVTNFGFSADTDRFDATFAADVARGRSITGADLDATLQFSDRLTGEADLSFGAGMRPDSGDASLRFDGENTDADATLSFANGDPSRFTGSLDHTGERFSFGLDADHDFQTGNTNLDADLGFQGEDLQFDLGIDTENGRITSGELDATLQFSDRLTGEADLNFGEGMRLDSGDVGLSFDGENTDADATLSFANGDPSRLTGSLDHTGERFSFGLDADHDFQTGNTNLDADLGFQGEDLQFDLGIDTENGRITSGELDATLQFSDRLTGEADLNFGEGMRFDSGDVGLSFDGENTDVDAALSFANGDPSRLTGSLTHTGERFSFGLDADHDLQTGDTNLDADLGFQGEDLQFDLGIDTENGRITSGELDATLQFSDRLTGEADLNFGEGMRFDNGDASLRFDGVNTDATASAHFQDGALATADLDIEHTRGDLTLGANIDHDVRTGDTDAGLSFSLERDAFTFDGSLDLANTGDGFQVTDGALGFSHQGENLTFGADLNLGAGAAFEGADLNLTLGQQDGNRFGATAAFDENMGLDSANFQGFVGLSENTEFEGELALGEGGRPSDVSIGLRHDNGPFNLSAEFGHDFATDRNSGRLGVDFNPNDNFSLGGRVEFDDRGDASAGFNLSIRF